MLAERQHGVVARRQLLGLGVSDEAIEHRLAKGRLHKLGRGIYAVGRRELSREGRWMAAVLGCGSRAVLSHRSGGALWGICTEHPRRIEVSVPFPSPRRRPGVEVHRRPKLREADVTEHSGIPVTIPVRTMIDLAHVLDARSLEQAVNEADRLDLVDPASLLRALADYPGQRGVGALRALLGDRVFRLTDSELETHFLRLVRRSRLPLPLTQQRVNGYRVDFFWPELGLVVETDGLRYHRTPTQQSKDRKRDQAHTAAGLTQLRFTHAQVRYDARDVEATLARTVGHLEAEHGAPPGPRRRAA
jgi:very-short-patch-repair endonuclease